MDSNESKQRTTLKYSLNHIPVWMDQAIEEYQLEKYKQTSIRPTKNGILLDAIEIGLKSMGVIE